MSSFERLLIGRRIADRYRVETLLGRGGMGAVFRAHDERLLRAVALKILSVPTVNPDESGLLRTRFLREARAAAAIVHPNVVTIYDFGTDPALDLDFIVMELLEGADLAKLLADGGPRDPAWVRNVLRQAAEGLAAGHAKGIVHRDVKPANLFVSPGAAGPHVRVLDFGIAQAAMGEETLTRLTRFGASPLSPGFASPEQLGGRAALTPASDVFSLGLTGIALLTGQPQRDGAVAGVVDWGAHAAEVARSGFRDVLLACVRADPAWRPPNAAAVAAALAGTGPARVVTGPATPAPRPAVPAAPRAAQSPPPPYGAGSARRLRNARSAAETDADDVSVQAGWIAAFVALVVVLVFAVRFATSPSSAESPSSAAPAPIPDTPSDTTTTTSARDDRQSEGTPPPARSRPPYGMPGEPEHPWDPPPTDIPKIDPNVDLPSPGNGYELSAVDEQPVLSNLDDVQRELARQYPPLLRDAGVPGTVTLRMRIMETGRVDPESISVESTTHDQFSEAALRVVGKMRFRPAKVSGRPVRVWVNLPLTFQLQP